MNHHITHNADTHSSYSVLNYTGVALTFLGFTFLILNGFMHSFIQGSEGHTALMYFKPIGLIILGLSILCYCISFFTNMASLSKVQDEYLRLDRKVSLCISSILTVFLLLFFIVVLLGGI